MSAKILVATPIRSFGELIAQALQEIGYYPLLVADVPNALDAARVEDFTLAVLDCEMPPPGTEFLAAALREQMRDLRLLFFHPDASCQESVTLRPGTDLRLPQPFYLPDLLTTVERMLPLKDAPAPPRETAPPPPAETPPELEWLRDTKKARRYLEHFLGSTGAQAALIVRSGGMLANAGELPRERAGELAALLARRWDDTRPGDLLLFVRLAATGTAYTLYARGMGGGHVLLLAFPPETPLQKMRTQAREMHARLTAPLPDLPRSPQAAAAPKADSPPAAADPGEAETDDSLFEDDWSLEDDPELARQAAMFEQLLADIDLPDPDGK